MAEKLKLDLSLVSPDVPDQRDAYVGVEADNCETNWPTNLKLSTNM